MSGSGLSLRSRSRRRADPVLLSLLAKCPSMLDLSASTPVSGEWPTIIDVKNSGSPMTQPAAVRKAAVGTSPSGLPTMVFDGTDVHLWPSNPGHLSTTTWGLWVDFWPASLPANQAIYAIANGVGGATATRMAFYSHNQTYIIEVYITNADGRSFVTGNVASTSAFQRLYLQYDSSRGGTNGDNNVALYINGGTPLTVGAGLTASSFGSGGTITTLRAATGSAVVGGFSDTDTPLSGITNGGQLGSILATFNQNLTAAEIARMMRFRSPT